MKNEDFTEAIIPRSYAFCSDTAYHEPIIEQIRKVSFLYHEATFGEDAHPQAQQTLHSTAKQAAQIAQKAEVEKLLIGHFSIRYKDPKVLLAEAQTVFPSTQLAIEGQTFGIG